MGLFWVLKKNMTEDEVFGHEMRRSVGGKKITWKSKETGSKLSRLDSRVESVFSWLWEDWIEDGLNVRGRDGEMFGMLDLKDRNKIWVS